VTSRELWRGLAPSDLTLRADFATDLARDAGALALSYFRREIAFATELKGPQDFVSAADRAVEALIRERIARAFPQDTMFGEEAGGDRFLNGPKLPGDLCHSTQDDIDGLFRCA